MAVTDHEGGDLPEADDAVRAVEEGRDVRIIDETPHSMFVEVRTGEGWTQMNKSKNPRNVLMFKHGMYGLVRGVTEEIYEFDTEKTCRISSDDKSSYTLWVGDREPLNTSPDRESQVLEAVKRTVETGEAWPLENVYQAIRDNQVRHKVINQLLSEAPFSVLRERGTIEADDRGWLIHGHLLLTWEVDLLNDTDDIGYRVDGSGVSRSQSTNSAFELDIDVDSNDMERPVVELDGKEYKFGAQEMRFIATALWVVKNVSPRGAGKDTPALDGNPDNEN